MGRSSRGLALPRVERRRCPRCSTPADPFRSLVIELPARGGAPLGARCPRCRYRLERGWRADEVRLAVLLAEAG